MHPEDEAGAVRIGVRVKAKLGDFVRRCQQGLEFGLERELGRVRKRARDLLRMRRDLLERTRAVQMLRAANEPDLRGGEINHSRLSFHNEWSFAHVDPTFLAGEVWRSATRTTVIPVAHI